MVVNDFTQNSEGFWVATATASSSFDLHLEFDPRAGKYNSSVQLKWKGASSDSHYADVTTSCPKDGVYNEQFKSEFYPVYIQVVCGSKPKEVRLTEH